MGRKKMGNMTDEQREKLKSNKIFLAISKFRTIQGRGSGHLAQVERFVVAGAAVSVLLEGIIDVSFFQGFNILWLALMYQMCTFFIGLADMKIGFWQVEEMTNLTYNNIFFQDVESRLDRIERMLEDMNGKNYKVIK